MCSSFHFAGDGCPHRDDTNIYKYKYKYKYLTIAGKCIYYSWIILSIIVYCRSPVCGSKHSFIIHLLQEDDENIIFTNMIEDVQASLQPITVICTFPRHTRVVIDFCPCIAPPMVLRVQGKFVIEIHRYYDDNFKDRVIDQSLCPVVS